MGRGPLDTAIGVESAREAAWVPLACRRQVAPSNVVARWVHALAGSAAGPLMPAFAIQLAGRGAEPTREAG